ncbi:MAG: hypothetical protein LBJ73_05235 [Rickettsiales bacterium]|jgi:hypothetical protein|nr:hypothetical protein [Rickettsiales bacterium]
MRKKAAAFALAGLSLLGPSARAQTHEFENVGDFIKKYQSPPPRINRDSISMLPPEIARAIYRQARKRDVHVQVDTIVVNKISDGYYNYGYVDRALNLIQLNYYIVADDCDCNMADGTVYPIEEVRRIFDEQNNELPWHFIHEAGHLHDAYLNIGALSPPQWAQFEFNSEIRARLNVLQTKFPKWGADRLIDGALAEMEPDHRHYAQNRMPELLRGDARAALEYQRNYIAWKHKSPNAARLDSAHVQVKSFDEITRLQYTFGPRGCLLDSARTGTIKKLSRAVMRYISVPELAAVIAELEQSEAAMNLPSILAVSGIRPEQDFDVIRRHAAVKGR